MCWKALVGRRARRDRQYRAAAVEQHEAGVERARRGAHDVRQPGARFDRLGDRVQRRKIERDRPFGGSRHAHRLRSDAIPVVREGRSTGRAHQEQGRQDVQAEEAGRDPLPQVAVRVTGGPRDEPHERDEGQHAAGAGDQDGRTGVRHREIVP